MLELEGSLSPSPRPVLLENQVDLVRGVVGRLEAADQIYVASGFSTSLYFFFFFLDLHNFPQPRIGFFFSRGEVAMFWAPQVKLLLEADTETYQMIITMKLLPSASMNVVFSTTSGIIDFSIALD